MIYIIQETTFTRTTFVLRQLRLWRRTTGARRERGCRFPRRDGSQLRTPRGRLSGPPYFEKSPPSRNKKELDRRLRRTVQDRSRETDRKSAKQIHGVFATVQSTTRNVQPIRSNSGHYLSEQICSTARDQGQVGLRKLAPSKQELDQKLARETSDLEVYTYIYIHMHYHCYYYHYHITITIIYAYIYIYIYTERERERRICIYIYIYIYTYIGATKVSTHFVSMLETISE